MYAVGAKNIYLSIYELSPLLNDPIPAQQQKYREISRMLLCLLLFTSPAFLQAFTLSPALSPGRLGI